jgi:lysozyme family protein
MADFLTAYNKYIRPNEGGYVNNPNDKGGETYAGIARNFHPNWEGWTVIDFEKRTRGLKFNQLIPDIDYMVEDFYRAMWDKYRLSEIQNQQIADFMFDFIVHSSSTAVKKIQTAAGVTADGVIGNMTLGAINTASATISGAKSLLNKMIEQRELLFKAIVARDPTQGEFLAGWNSRLNKFKNTIVDTVKKNPGKTLLVTGFVLTAGYFLLGKH